MEKVMDLDKIMSKMIRKSFPELINVNILIEFAETFQIDDCYFIYGTVKGGFFIHVEESLKNFNPAITEGGIAHELCHILWARTISRVHEKTDSRLYVKYWHHRQRDEKYTDLETILRGYGPQLRLAMDHYHKYPPKEYLAGKYCGLTIDDFKKLKV